MEFQIRPVTHEKIAAETEKDVVLQQDFEHTMNGWPNDVSSNLKAYWIYPIGFSVLCGCLLREDHVAVPLSLR